DGMVAPGHPSTPGYSDPAYPSPPRVSQELAHVTCPIGLPGIAGKEPEVIAVSVAAQLLATLPPAPRG
ncbi:XdhC family protein, partial [Paracidovorax avenae]|uniref:XdhC family protein n=1 Tax=Paracidovorax avenae TaxID=80867 RepID=UPI001CEF8745